MSLAACAEIVRRGDPDRFLAAMSTPPACRARLFPIYAFNLEVARAPWLTSEPTIARIRHQWWRDALAEIAAGQDVRRHEVVTPLAGVLDAAGARLLRGLVDARDWDIERPPFADAAALDAYLDATAGTLMWVSARALGVSDGEAAIRTIGRGAGLAGFLQAVPRLANRGRSPLPDPSEAAVAALAEAALGKMGAARRQIPRAARPATRSAWLAPRILRLASANPSAVAAGTLHISEFSRRGALLMRLVRDRL